MICDEGVFERLEDMIMGIGHNSTQELELGYAEIVESALLNVDDLAGLFFNAFVLRTKKVSEIISFLAFADSKWEEIHPGESLKKAVFNRVAQSMKSNLKLSNQANMCCVLWHLLKEEQTDINSILGIKPVIDHHQCEPVLVVLSRWFAPELCAIDRERLRGYLKLPWVWHTVAGFGKSLQRFQKNYDALEAEDWKLMRQQRDTQHEIGTVGEIIKKDDIERLIRLAEDPAFDWNMRIENSIWEPAAVLQYNPTILQFAAYYGAVECFRFLLQNEADPKQLDDVGRSVIQFAVFGGDQGILRLCEAMEWDVSEVIGAAVDSCSNEVFEWILETRKPKEVNINDVIVRAAKANNVYAMRWSLERGASLESVDPDDLTPIMLTAAGNNRFLFEYLLAKGASLTHLGDNQMTILHHAAVSNAYQIVERLIGLEGIDINAIDRSKVYFMFIEHH